MIHDEREPFSPIMEHSFERIIKLLIISHLADFRDHFGPFQQEVHTVLKQAIFNPAHS